MFAIESRNQIVDGQTDGQKDIHRTHQSNRVVGYTQQGQKYRTKGSQLYLFIQIFEHPQSYIFINILSYS